MTKNEFKMELWHYGQEQRAICGASSPERRARIARQALVARKALLDAYDAMAARIAELEAQVAAMDREMMSMAATSDGFQMDAMFARERIAALVLRVILDSRVVLHRGAIQRAHDLLDGGEG